MSDRLAYTRDEAAEAVGVSVDTIKRAIAAGQLATVSPPITDKRRVSRVLITAAELTRWLSAP
jgi:excisionase family DNA binding protein